jgi:hypothetical protein
MNEEIKDIILNNFEFLLRGDKLYIKPITELGAAMNDGEVGKEYFFYGILGTNGDQSFPIRQFLNRYYNFNMVEIVITLIEITKEVK